MRTPVIVLCGVDPQAMASATVAVQFELPHAVVVHHRLEPETQVLERVVSDVTGVIEHERLHLDHACVTCAVREDVVPTLERLAADGRWGTIVAHLPVGAGADQVCGVLARDTRLARRLRVASVVTALAATTLVEDLLGPDLLLDRDAHTSLDDVRGLGEVACAMVEYADVVVAVRPDDTRTDPSALALVATLGQPTLRVVDGSDQLEGRVLLGPLHTHARTVSWCGEVRTGVVGPPASPLVWRLDLRSPHALHPTRLLDDLESLGTGRHRSRGHFWLPTRPGAALAWLGAGGQLSIGTAAPWGARPPGTRIVLTGVGAAPERVRAAFGAMLVTEAERADLGAARRPVEHDGFEPWLGAIQGAA